LIITERSGNYLAFFVEYLPTNPTKGWDIQHFEGKVKLTSIDGKEERTISINTSSTYGRMDAIVLQQYGR
jgi:hypothetical protein